jgi:hypothetical protein
LLHGLPKHLEAIANTDENAYLEIVPGKNACSRCQAMRGRRFLDKPGPVHPNCACEIRRVARRTQRPRVVAYGLLQGYEDAAFERFDAGQQIDIRFLNLGPFPAGVAMRIDRAGLQSTGFLLPGVPKLFQFSKFGEAPLSWTVYLITQGFDGSTIEYMIRG